MVEDKRAYLRQANDTKLVCCQVETRQAVENLDEILEVDGVDVYFIGPGDLAASYGEPASSPKMLELTERMIRRIVAAGKTVTTTWARLRRPDRPRSGGPLSGHRGQPVHGVRRQELPEPGTRGRGGGRLLRVLRRPPWRTCT
ncbi:aldolase/citrate lyase family protein [Flavonifractor plautii]|nr:aldolase/citrate lyase family protein [Flavonifractor plautii]